VSQILASEGKDMASHKDYTALYQEIADYVIIKAHSGDPLFERIFVSAWNKTTLRQSKDLTGSKEPDK
jgi:hypothetical protein